MIHFEFNTNFNSDVCQIKVSGQPLSMNATSPTPQLRDNAVCFAEGAYLAVRHSCFHCSNWQGGITLPGIEREKEKEKERGKGEEKKRQGKKYNETEREKECM